MLIEEYRQTYCIREYVILSYQIQKEETKHKYIYFKIYYLKKCQKCIFI